MIRDEECSMSLKDKYERSITFGNNDKAKIKGIRTIRKDGYALIDNVQYV